MREILFKAKRLNNDEWVKGCYMPRPNSPGKSRYYIVTVGEAKWFEIDPKTICQYTGLTDKNGKRIWENDIVKDSVVLGSVVWDEHYAQFMIDDVWCDEHQEYTDLWNEVDVIGNAFDNPELLRQEGKDEQIRDITDSQADSV